MTGEIRMISYTSSASTASSEVVRAITKDPKLQQKTALVVIDGVEEPSVFDIYRASGTARGMYSRDSFVWDGTWWDRQGKDDRKFAPGDLPWPPQDSIEETLDGVRVSTRAPMTDAARKTFVSRAHRRPPDQ